MVIDVDFLVDEYIHYHQGHAKELIPEATSVFAQKYADALNEIKSSTKETEINATIMSMRNQGKSAAGVLSFADSLENGSSLEQILDAIAADINEGIAAYENSVDVDNYQSILNGVYNLSGMLEGGAAGIQNVKEFFEYLHKALLLLGPDGKISASQVAALAGIGQVLSGSSSFGLTNWTDVTAVGEEDIQLGAQVIKYLSNAASKLNTGGAVSAESFRGTITAIFHTSITKILSKVLIAQGIAQVEQQADSIVDQQVKSSGGKLTYISSFQKHSREFPVPRGKLIDTSEFEFSATIGGKEINLEIICDIGRLNWGKRGNKKPIQIISGGKLKDYIDEGKEKYLGYNIITHRNTGGGAFTQAYEQVRAGVAASYFSDWLATGKSKMNFQFFMIGDRVYSINRIVRNICEDVRRRSIAFSMDTNTAFVANKWIGTGPDWGKAVSRSDLITAVLNTLQIAATLNSNILKKYAY